tara:strand:+ start:617 stop:1324 length:708 start_codon:yes stop_codon:yes gene_type:complete
MIKLLDTSGSNTKLRKNNRDIKLRVAGLSLMPDDALCPMRNIAECKNPCLRYSGRGVFDNVIDARQAKTNLFHNDRAAFIAQLKRELVNFEKLCAKNNVEPWVRLNVISDVQWELKANGSIPQSFPNIKFFDYTKLAKRLGNTPDNYDLMFSWSGAKKYQDQVGLALTTDAPISAVFHGPMPDTFLGRAVVNGDNSDIENIFQTGKILGLKYKLAKGQSIDPMDSVFIIDTRLAA